jgi:hypothetical protein
MSTARSAADAWVVAASLLIVALCWWWIVAMAGDVRIDDGGRCLDDDEALGLAAHGAPVRDVVRDDGGHDGAFGGGRDCERRTDAARHAAGSVAPRGAFVAAYVLVWMLFSLAATLAQRVLYELHLLSPMMEPATTALAGGLLLAAGVYQLLPFERTCLASCRGLAGLRRQDRTVAEAFRAGLHYGRACLASNWLLMLLLFAGGVMNLAMIAALTGVVLVEKIAPLGMRSTWVTGGLLVGLSLWTLG